MAKGMSKTKKQGIIKWVIGAILLIGLAIYWFVIKPDSVTYDVPDGTAEIHFIDVGQGDSTLIKVGDKNVLIDTGENSAKNALFTYLDNHSVTVIDYFIITHFDSDHFANATAVLETYDVVKLITPDQVKTTKMYETFMAKVEEQVESGLIEPICANDMIGQSITLADLEIKILSPLDDYSNSNDYSIATLIRYGNKRVLMTGDCEDDAEEDIVARYSKDDLDCDVYKLGHHGSRTSSSQELLDKATPDYIIISCGLNNDYGHPHSETMERVEGKETYRTDTQGSIVLTIANDELTFETEK